MYTRLLQTFKLYIRILCKVCTFMKWRCAARCPLPCRPLNEGLFPLVFDKFWDIYCWWNCRKLILSSLSFKAPNPGKWHRTASSFAKTVLRNLLTAAIGTSMYFYVMAWSWQMSSPIFFPPSLARSFTIYQNDDCLQLSPCVKRWKKKNWVIQCSCGIFFFLIYLYLSHVWVSKKKKSV